MVGVMSDSFFFSSTASAPLGASSAATVNMQPTWATTTTTTTGTYSPYYPQQSVVIPNWGADVTTPIRCSCNSGEPCVAQCLICYKPSCFACFIRHFADGHAKDFIVKSKKEVHSNERGPSTQANAPSS